MFRLLVSWALMHSILQFAVAQDPVMIPVNSAETPLPSNAFYVFNDSRQQIWIATNSGVYKYNGYEFQHLTSADGLGDNEILKIYEDRKGRIWFLSINGNPSFYLNGKVYNSSNNDLLAKLQFKKMMLTAGEDDEGNLYIGSREYVYFKIDRRDSVTQLMYEGAENFLWTDGEGAHFVDYKSLGLKGYVRGDQQGDLVVIGSKFDLFEKRGNESFRHIALVPEGKAEIIFVAIRNEDEYYIGTRDGLFIWNRSSPGKFRHLMRTQSISSVEFDFENNIWVSTLESGVFIIPSTEINIYSTTNYLPENKITCIEHDSSGNLWIGMAKDYGAILKSDGIFNQFRMPAASTHPITNIRHFGNETYVLSKRGILKFRGEESQPIESYANDLLISGNGNVFIGQDNLLKVTRKQFDTELLRIVENIMAHRDELEIITARTNVLKEDSKGAIWIGTSKGLFVYDDSLIACSRFDPLFNSPVRDISFDQQGKYVFVATLNGLLVLEQNKLIKVIDKSSKLPNSECNALFTDGNDRLWAAFGNELVCVSTDASFSLINYSDNYKIECGRITDIDVMHSTVYVATENGLVYFNLNGLQRYSQGPVLNLTEFKVNDEPQQMNALVDFRYDQNDISITYLATSFLSRSQIQYAYLLEGYDEEWHSTKERSIHFKSLPAGTYTFRIKAVNKSSLESDEKSITFTILPPVWATFWFRMLMLAVAVSIILLLWFVRIKSVKRSYEQKNKTLLLENEKMEAEKKLMELEQQAFRQQMNPHFIFNALNTIKGYYAENDIKRASEYITKFSRLLRMILENSKQLVALEHEIESLRLYLELTGLRYENKFTFSFDVDPAIPADETGIPPMLLQPFIENAIIHGISPKTGNGNIKIQFNKAGETLECCVIDNGIGRDASNSRNKNIHHHSRATEIITEYLKALNKKDMASRFTIAIEDLYDQSAQPVGTKVIISIPFMTIW